MSLGEFGCANLMVEIAVPWWNQTLWWVSDARGIPALEAEGVSRGRIWTADELTHLNGIDGLWQNDLRTIGVLKVRLGCDIQGVQPEPHAVDAAPGSPAVCRTCHERRFWRSIYGQIVCGLCHPPAHPRLVAEWIDTAAEGE